MLGTVIGGYADAIRPETEPSRRLEEGPAPDYDFRMTNAASADR